MLLSPLSGYNSDPFTEEDAVNERILQLQCCEDGQYVPLSSCFLNVSSDPLQPCMGSSHVSFGRSFARALLPSLSAYDLVLLVATAIPGTGFVSGTWNAYNGSGFKPAVQDLQRAWEILHAAPWQGWRVSFDGVLWHQGECDAGDNGAGLYANTSQYLYADILPMIAALRDTSFIKFTSPSLPFVAGQMVPSWMDNSSHPIRQGVKVALSLLPQYCPYTALASSYGLLGDTDPRYSSGLDHEVIHFTAASQRLLGKRYYAAYQQALVNYPVLPVKVEMANVRMLSVE